MGIAARHHTGACQLHPSLFIIFFCRESELLTAIQATYSPNNPVCTLQCLQPPAKPSPIDHTPLLLLKDVPQGDFPQSDPPQGDPPQSDPPPDNPQQENGPQEKLLLLLLLFLLQDPQAPLEKWQNAPEAAGWEEVLPDQANGQVCQREAGTELQAQAYEGTESRQQSW